MSARARAPEADPGGRAPVIHHVRRGSGEPLLLVHGIGGTLAVWEPVLDVLTRAREVIAVDLPGFGASPPLPEGEVPTPAALAGVLRAFLADIGVERPHLGGHSLGGWITLEMARLGAARSVTALCPALWRRPLLGAEAPAARNLNLTLGRRFSRLLPPLLATPPGRRLAFATQCAHPERIPRAAALAMARSYLGAPGYAATNAAMRRGCFGGGADIEAPVTLAWGEQDRLMRPVSVEIPDVRVVSLPGCGHLPFWDDPELVARVLLEGSR